MKVAILKELSPFLAVTSRHLRQLALGTFAGLAAAAAAVGLMSLSGWFISAAAAAGLAPATAYLFNFFLPSIGVRIFAILRTIARYAERILSHDATFRILEGLRVWFYRHMEPLAPAGLWRFRSGDILNRIVADIEALDNLYLRAFSPAAIALLISILVFFWLAVFDEWVAVLFWLLLAFAGIGVSVGAARAAGPAGRRIASSSAQLRARMVEGLQGLAEIIAFGAAGRHQKAVRRSQAELMTGQRRMAHIRGLSAAAMHVFSGAAVLSALYLGCARVSAGRMDGAALALIALAVTAAFETVFALPAAYQFLGRTRAAGGRLLEVVEADPPVSFTGPCLPAPACSDVCFEDVSFRYRPGLPLALTQVTISVPQGRRIAIVGESGAGKSTLAGLLVRFFDPESGVVRIGAVDLRSLSEFDLRRGVVLLSQQSHLFSDTIRANLLLAKPDAGDAELRGALAAARLMDFVGHLPDGLDTWVGEAGQLMSAGQARRLAVARAILRDAPVWVLDEPTEGLDRLTEAELVESLLEVTRGRTVLWITHRLVGMERMDAVAVLDQGRVTAHGTHAELLAQHARYAAWCAQML
ncbi:MAG: thiol reductant ABC exporter subunit CydC [Hyphomicrobiales bacterium]